MANLAPVGSFAGVGNSVAVTPRADLTATGWNVSIWGTFVGTVSLQRSFDSGVTWLSLTLNGAATATWTAPASEHMTETEQGVLYRLSCTAYTSGTINYRLSQ